MRCFVSLVLVVSSSAIDCLKRLVSEMTFYVSSATFNLTLSVDVGFVDTTKTKPPRCTSCAL